MLLQLDQLCDSSSSYLCLLIAYITDSTWSVISTATSPATPPLNQALIGSSSIAGNISAADANAY